MMGIHTDSPSIVSVVVRNVDEKERVNSQLRASARELYLHPSPWGAHVVHAILSSTKLYAAWWVHVIILINPCADHLKAQRDQGDVGSTTQCQRQASRCDCQQAQDARRVGSLEAGNRDVHVSPTPYLITCRFSSPVAQLCSLLVAAMPLR